MLVEVFEEHQSQPASVVKKEIRRHVEQRGDRWIEVSDSRLNPGEETVLEVSISGLIKRVHFQVIVEPDAMYQQKYRQDYGSTQDAGTVKLITQAFTRASENRYVLFDEWRKFTLTNKIPSTPEGAEGDSLTVVHDSAFRQ